VFSAHQGFSLYRHSRFNVQAFYFFSGPRGSSQKPQTGLDAGIFREAVYPDSSRHLFPSVFFNQIREDHFKGNTMKRVFVFIIDHRMPLFPVCEIVSTCRFGTLHLTFTERKEVTHLSVI